MSNLKTKSIRARLIDAAKIEHVSRVLSVELERQVPVSEVVASLMECLNDAEERIKRENVKAS